MHRTLPYVARWQAWNTWIVVYTHVRQGKGREVARFNGKFADLRAKFRARLRNDKWFQEHRPKFPTMPAEELM